MSGVNATTSPDTSGWQWCEVDTEELDQLREDVLLVEQELDVRPGVATSLETLIGVRAGRRYWRSEHDHLYAIELTDKGRGRPSSATVFGFWARYEPRPPEHEIDADLAALGLLIAETSPDLVAQDVSRVYEHAAVPGGWPDGSVLRTPDERFRDLDDFPYEPRYVDIEGLRMAWVETGDTSADDVVLCLHGEPTWGYLYRHMMPRLGKLGRVVVPDLIGFGRSDKPVADNAYSYRSHSRWLRKFVEALDLEKVTLVCQDWGGLLGLRVVSQIPQRFARIVAMNTLLPSGEEEVADAFLTWRRYSQQLVEMPVADLMQRAVVRPDFSRREAQAYLAPFPDKSYQTAVQVFPRLVPIRRDHAGAYDNRRARARLAQLGLPCLLAWADGEEVTRSGEADLRSLLSPATETLAVESAGHFLQEDRGDWLAGKIASWMEST